MVFYFIGAEHHPEFVTFQGTAVAFDIKLGGLTLEQNMFKQGSYAWFRSFQSH